MSCILDDELMTRAVDRPIMVKSVSTTTFFCCSMITGLGCCTLSWVAGAIPFIMVVSL